MADAGPRPCIYVLAGTNGAGKSSLAGAAFLQAGVEYFNADQAARLIRARNPRATQVAATNDTDLITVEADACVLAIGQQADLSFLTPGDGVDLTPGGTIKTDPVTLATSAPGVYAGGDVAFGKDGMLYITSGDGTSDSDTNVVGQDLTTLLSKVLRIDVDRPDKDRTYSVPADNPTFPVAGARPETWAYGFRNPYRMSFDMGGSHSLFAGDAGQELWEEVDMVVKGGNYGWNVREGTHCFDAENPFVSPPDCPDAMPDGTPLLDPVIEYPNAKNPEGGLGFAVVGGFVYRGALPQFKGR